MPVRLRKLIGTVLIVILVIVYALAATTFASLLLGAAAMVGASRLFLLHRPVVGAARHADHQVDGKAGQAALSRGRARMKIAVIADIHGNDLALEAVLADIDAHGHRRRGQSRRSPERPAQCRPHGRYPDGARLSFDPRQSRSLAGHARSGRRWAFRIAHAHDELQPRHLDWLRALPATLVHRQELFLCHGTPQDDLIYWLEDLTADGVVHMSARQRIEGFAAGIDFPVILCGHTHIPRAVRLADGRLIVNPGSVGCPGYDDDEPVPPQGGNRLADACYAILSKSQGHWDVTFRRVRYDHMTMSHLARSARPRRNGPMRSATGWLDG